jgi:hypothetical protein
VPYGVQQWPDTVYPSEVDEACPDAREVIDVLIQTMRRTGPRPDGYQFKPLGQKMEGLWQINLRMGRQIRVLYAPYGLAIVLFRIHKKGSPQEQARAYELAKSGSANMTTGAK